jgi:hypothetical protein
LARWTGCSVRNCEWRVEDDLVDAISAEGMATGAFLGFKKFCKCVEKSQRTSKTFPESNTMAFLVVIWFAADCAVSYKVETLCLLLFGLLKIHNLRRQFLLIA